MAFDIAREALGGRGKPRRFGEMGEVGTVAVRQAERPAAVFRDRDVVMPPA
jgi:hypothetical protein